MLTPIQQKLLELLKELDKICRENDIHYTLGGGTAIGAIRNRGFIPWDDDIDLYMTRDNWEKFKAAEAAGKFPQNRIAEAAETDINYTNTIPRYIATDSSSVHSHQLIYSDPAGHVIDVFVFDPLHFDNYRRYLEDLMLYSDLVDETKSYSSRFDMNRWRYPNALRKCETGHKEQVISELLESLTHMDDPGWQYYINEWGVAPFLFPASIFDGGYVRIPFEDTTVEIVRNYSEYLTWQYGDEWFYVPPHDEQEREGHEAIFSNTIPYTVVRADYMPFIEAGKVRRAYLKRKLRLLEVNPYRRKAEKAELESRAVKCRNALIRKLAIRALTDDGPDMEELSQQGRFYELAGVFKEYLDVQLGIEFAGRRDKHSSLRRYSYPVTVPVDTRTAEIAAETLLRTERMAKAMRFIEILTGDFEENLSGSDQSETNESYVNSQALKALRQEILDTRELVNESMTEGADPAEIYRRTGEFLKKYNRNSRIMRIRLGLLIADRSLESGGDADKEIRKLVKALVRLCPPGTPAYAEVLKYGADYMDEGPDTYREIYSQTRNGCLMMELEDRFGDEVKKAPDSAAASDEAEDGAAEPAEEASSANGEAEAEETVPAVPVKTGTEKVGMKDILKSVRSGGKGGGAYEAAKKLYRKIAGRDDRIKARTWAIACRTRDRVVLLEKYEDRIAELEALREKSDWDALAAEMAEHEAAVLRNLDIGLGLSVHPVLTEIQDELFRRSGREDIADKAQELIPDQHRLPVTAALYAEDETADPEIEDNTSDKGEQVPDETEQNDTEPDSEVPENTEANGSELTEEL